MQISNEQVSSVLRRSRGSVKARSQEPVGSVEELAARHGVSMEEVRRFTERALVSEGDPLRERRLAELEGRIEAGSYSVQSEALVDMAERRAIADRAGEL